MSHIRPGDAIEWYYTHPHNRAPVRKDDRVRNTDQLASLDDDGNNRWLPIGGNMFHLLVSIDDEWISWLNEEGYFRARRQDSHSAWGEVSIRRKTEWNDR